MASHSADTSTFDAGASSRVLTQAGLGDNPLAGSLALIGRTPPGGGA